MLNDRKQIKPKQTLLDLAIQHTGAPEGILQFVASGQYETFNELTDSTKKITVSEVLDSDVVAAIKKTGVSPSTYRDSRDFSPSPFII